MAKETIMLHFKDADLLEDLTDEELGVITRALMICAMSGEEPEFSDRHLRSVFKHLHNQHQKDARAYADICDKRKAAAGMRWNSDVQMDANACKSMQMDANDAHRIGKEGIGKDSKKKNIKKKKHGQYKHVLLTDEEYDRLISDYGEEATASAIKKVDEYCEQHGKTYKNYNLTLRKWGFDKTVKLSDFAKELANEWG